LAGARQGVPAPVWAAAQALGLSIAAGFTRHYDHEPTSLLLMEGSYRRPRWRPTPPTMAPTELPVFPAFLAPFRHEWLDPGPPAPGTAAFQQDLYEVREWGDALSTRRSAAQTEAARYWVGRDLGASGAAMAAAAVAARPAGLHTDARAMALVCAGMADSYLAWVEGKRHYDFWRPVTAIRELASTPAERDWLPLLGTPAHPDFPSGHATDITTIEALLGALFGRGQGAIHFRGEGEGGLREREFASLPAAAEECRQSRLWAGAHYRFANDAGRRLGETIAREAMRHLGPLSAKPV